MKVDIPKKVCSTCPFRKENAHQLTKDTIKHMVEYEIISACHQVQAKTEGCTETTGVEKYAHECKDLDKPFMLCRGFTEARALMKRDHKNPLLKSIDKMQEEFGYTDGLVRMDYIYGAKNDK